MLRVEFHDMSNTVVMRIEGRFVGEYAEETRQMVKRNLPQLHAAEAEANRSNVAMKFASRTIFKIVVDVSEVTFVDDAGEQVLTWLGRAGAKFLADSSYARDVCERLHLPKTRKRTPSKGQVKAFADPADACKSTKSTNILGGSEIADASCSS